MDAREDVLDVSIIHVGGRCVCGQVDARVYGIRGSGYVEECVENAGCEV